jgi:hypothetical protein
MKMSVSTSSSATPPLVSGGHRGSRIGAECFGQRSGGIDVVVEIDVEGSADDLGHRNAFSVGEWLARVRFDGRSAVGCTSPLRVDAAVKWAPRRGEREDLNGALPRRQLAKAAPATLGDDGYRQTVERITVNPKQMGGVTCIPRPRTHATAVNFGHENVPQRENSLPRLSEHLVGNKDRGRPRTLLHDD